jgi:VIT1/CCC1 family predicted Fe2+/Mn2+ transporter
MTPRADDEHTQAAIHRRLSAAPRQSYLRDWVYGGIDGTVTTFAIVSGVVGAHLPSHIILILGSASLIADGVAMGAANYLATRAEAEEIRFTEALERRQIADAPEGEREEVREIFRNAGLEGDVLERIVALVTADVTRWVRVMLREEYGLPVAVRVPWRAATSTFLAFLVCGLVPLMPFAAGLSGAFWTAVVATSLMFIGIGAVKSRWSIYAWWRSGVETLVAGGGAAIAAYVIGAWLRTLSLSQ